MTSMLTFKAHDMIILPPLNQVIEIKWEPLWNLLFVPSHEGTWLHESGPLITSFWPELCFLWNVADGWQFLQLSGVNRLLFSLPAFKCCYTESAIWFIPFWSCNYFTSQVFLNLHEWRGDWVNHGCCMKTIRQALGVGSYSYLWCWMNFALIFIHLNQKYHLCISTNYIAGG